MEVIFFQKHRYYLRNKTMKAKINKVRCCEDLSVRIMTEERTGMCTVTIVALSGPWDMDCVWHSDTVLFSPEPRPQEEDKLDSEIRVAFTCRHLKCIETSLLMHRTYSCPCETYIFIHLVSSTGDSESRMKTFQIISR
jgi:hypothetical protein